MGAWGPSALATLGPFSRDSLRYAPPTGMDKAPHHIYHGELREESRLDLEFSRVAGRDLERGEGRRKGGMSPTCVSFG